MSTTRLSVFIASSLDGYIATRKEDLAWLDEAAGSDEDYEYGSFLETVDSLAMGRQVFVFTHRPPQRRDAVTFWRASARTALDNWRAMGLGRVYVDGGALISDFLAVALIDDMVLTKVPILLGEGRPLFHPHPGAHRTAAQGSQELAQRVCKPDLLPDVARWTLDGTRADPVSVSTGDCAHSW